MGKRQRRDSERGRKRRGRKIDLCEKVGERRVKIKVSEKRRERERNVNEKGRVDEGVKGKRRKEEIESKRIRGGEGRDEANKGNEKMRREERGEVRRQ